MNRIVKAVLATVILLSLPLVGPVLFLMAFLAESGSEHINNIGRVLLGIYLLIYLSALYYAIKALVLRVVHEDKNKQNQLPLKRQFFY